jgi:predicted enzyme related to lactoylglutathione lyase
VKIRLPFGLVLTSAALLGGGALAATPATAPGAAMEPGHVTGLGGVFVKSKDPKALAAWYRDVLGISIEPWGGAKLAYDAPEHPAVLVWNAFPKDSDYFAPSSRDLMLNFAVDDMEAFLARLARKGVTPLKRDDKDSYGKFAWIVDPDGTKIELWQPKTP